MLIYRVQGNVQASDSSGVASRIEEAGTGIIIIPTTMSVIRLIKSEAEAERQTQQRGN